MECLCCVHSCVQRSSKQSRPDVCERSLIATHQKVNLSSCYLFWLDSQRGSRALLTAACWDTMTCVCLHGMSVCTGSRGWDKPF